MSQRRREKRLGKIVRALWYGRSGVEGLDRRLLMSVGPGNPDISFDFDGRLEVRSDLANPGRVVSTVQRSDGFTYVLTELPGAQGVPGVGGPSSDGVAITRLNDNGTVDLTWGSAGTGRFVFNVGLGVDGAVLLDRGAGSGFFIAGTAYAPRVGSGGFDRGGDFLLAAVTDGGQLDGGFNSGQGYKQYDLNLAGSQDDLISAGMDGSGNIILHGRHVSALGLTSAAFLKVDAGGNVVGPFGDTSFALAGGGFRDSQGGAISSGGQSMAVAADGSFVYAVNIGSSAQLRRFSLTGMLVDTRTLAGSSVFPKAVAIDNVGGGIYAAVTDVTNLVVFKSDPTAGLPASGGWGQGGVYSLNANFALITTADAALAVRSGGALAVAMRGTSNSAPVAAVIGIDVAGFRDTGFDAGGFRDFTSASNPGTLTINVGPTGRVLAGASFLASPFFTDAFATDLYRADSAGTPDATFGSQGRRFLDPFVGGSPTEVAATQVNSDGSVLSVWTTPTAPAGLQSIGVELSDRYGVRLGGSIFDAGRFAGNIKVAGVFKRTDGQYAVILSARDTLLGSADTVLLMGLVRSDGTVNPSFGINGFQQFSPSGDVGYTAESAARINNDLILISGATFTGSGPGQRSLTRVGLNGLLDTSFGSGGTVILSDFDSGTYRTVVASQTAGQRIYAVGTVRQSGVPSVQVDVFEFDGTFATTGQIGTAASQSFGVSAVLSSDGSRLYVGGRSVSGFNETAFLRSFVTSTAALDAGFGTAGVVTPSPSGFASGIRALALDPAGGLIGVGDANGVPYIQRFNATTGAVDTSYGSSVSQPFGQVGRYTSVTFDTASRPIVTGIVGSIGTSGARVGVVQRFQATAAVAPTLLDFDTRPFPKPGDAFGVVRAKFRAPVGLVINPSTFNGAIEYTRPDTSTSMAGVLSAKSPDGGRTWEVEFTYASASGGPLAAGDSGTYVFRLLQNSIADDVGNQFPTTTQTLATINVNLTGVPGPGDPDANFSGDGREEFTSDLSAGELIQIVERADGSTYLLSNLPPATDLPDSGDSVGFAITKLLPTGALDMSFGGDGRYTFSLLAGVSAVQLIDLGPGNGFMVAGSATRLVDSSLSLSGLSASELLLVKVADSGTTDLTFGGGAGYRLYNPTGRSVDPSGAVRLSDGSIILAFSSLQANITTAVLKVSAAGEPDAMFGDTSFRIAPGAFAAPAGQNFRPAFGSRSIAVDGNDRVFMIGTTSNFLHSAVFSFDSSGIFNTAGAFDSNGTTNFSSLFVTSTAPRAIVVAPLGSIFIGFQMTAGAGDVGVLKIGNTGIVDTTYGGGDGFFLFNADSGLTPLQFGVDLDLAAFSNDSVVVAATSSFAAGGPDNQTNLSTFILSSDGTFNTSYGGAAGGLVQIDLVRQGSGAHVSVANGTILAGGSQDRIIGDGLPANAVVARLDLTGAVVPTFTDGLSGAGRVSLGTIVDGAIGTAHAVHANPDGSSFTVYLTHDPRGGDAIGTRALDPNGGLIGGTLAGGGQFTEYSIAGIFKRTDGKYLVAFSAKADDGQFGSGLLVMALYDATGGLVTTYGSGGFLVGTPTASSDNTVTAMARVSDNQFLLVGREAGRPVLYRIDENGVAIGTTQLATGFGEAVAVQVDTTNGLVYVAYRDLQAPRIVGAGQPVFDAVIQRRFIGGAFGLDPSFGVNGVQRFSAAVNSNNVPQSLVLDAQASRLLLGGMFSNFGSTNVREFVAAFSTVNGSLDTTFGSGGQYVGSQSAVIASVHGLAVDGDGGYLLAGASRGLPALQKLSPSGVLDVNYGQQLRPSTAHYGEYLGLTLDRSGRPIVFGFEGQLEGAPRPGVVRRLTESVPVAAPLAQLFASSPFGGFGSATQGIEVSFTAFGVRTINEATLSGSNIILTLNGSPVGTATFNAVTFRDANVVRASYSLIAPGGAFNFTNNGSYVATLAPNSVADSAGVFASQAVVFSFTTNFQPVAVSLAVQPAEPRFGSPFVDITVQYAAADGASIDLQSINATNISLFRDGSPEGTVSVVSVNSTTADLVQVVYRLIPGGGAFVFSNNGFYEAIIQPGNSVRTTDGVPTPAGTIHTFTSNFQPVTASFATPAVPRIGDSTLQFSVTYSAAAGRLIDGDSIVASNIRVTGPNGETPVVTLVSVTGSGQSVMAVYAFAAPGGTFGPAVAGTYTFGVDPQSQPVRDDLGAPVPAGVIGSLVVQYVRPSAAVASSQLTTFGSSTSQFTITYTPGTGRLLDINSINGDEIRITRPDGSTITAMLISVTSNSGTAISPDPTITAVYSFTASGPIFGFGDVGQYAVDILPGSVTDTQNSPINAASLGNIAVVFERPTASATTPVTPALGATFVEFNVVYSAGSGSIVAQTTLGNDDIRVALPDGSFVLATLISSATGSDGTVLGTYRFSPSGGVFNGTNGGIYTVGLVAGGVSDSRSIPIAAGVLFSLTVAVSGVPGNLISVNVPAGPYLPGDVINPTVVVTNPLSGVASQPFILRFFIRISGATVAFGDINVNPLAAGATRTILFDGRLSLPASTQLLPGTYEIGARVIAADGSESGTAVVSPIQAVVTSVPLPTPGSLDPTFGGGDGIVTNFVPGPTITLVGSVAQAGSKLVSGGFDSNGDFVLLRFNADGSPDTTFGVAGQITLDVSGGTDTATTISDDPQGRIVLGGTSTVGGTTVFSVVRFNADGSLDTSFNGTGILLFTPDGSQASLLRGVTSDRFGRPYLLGSVRAPQTEGGPVALQGVVIRLTPSGTVDGSFGSFGVVSAAITDGFPGVLPFRDGQSELTSLLLLDDRIVVGGYSANSDGTASRFILAGLQYNGRLDTRFGTRGLYVTTLGTTLDRITVLLEAPDGDIYAGGSRGTATSTTAVIFRINANGKIDRGFNRGAPLPLNTNTTFGTVSSLLDSVNNTVLITVATAQSLAAAAAGQIGSVVFRVTAVGANDPFFNNGAPQIIFDPTTIQPAAAGDLSGSFDSFVQSKQGATQRVEGGRIRSLSATPVTEGTSITIAQLSQDGVDLRAVLTGNIPARVRPGFRGTAVLTVSNVGSLLANGRFSVTLVADGGTDVTLPVSILSGRIPQGATRTFRVRFALPANTPEGTYQMQATLGTVARSFTDINTGNNTTVRPGDFVVATDGVRAASTAIGLRSDDSADRRQSATGGLFSTTPLL